mmetsp:Transcript_5377/g.12984  ORF Transcript_5377/g.12984 Transcript_5377/m.12984 type:complete len:1528 (-) Transcript_5377:74-4657(-)
MDGQMEQLLAGAKFPAKCVKNEIHNLLTTLRLTTKKSTNAKVAQFQSSALRSFQELFEELTYIHELQDFDTVAYLRPFLEVIQSEKTDGPVTAVALAAVNKFVSFGLIHPDHPKCMEAINTLAWGVINCRFTSSQTPNDEVVLLKMVSLLIDCLRCPAGDYLSDRCVWYSVKKTWQISRQPRASHLLRSSAEGILQQMILTVFGTHKARARRVRVLNPGSNTDASPSPQQTPQVFRPYGFQAMHVMLRFLAFLLAYGRSTPSKGTEKGAVERTRPRRRRSSRSRSPGGSNADSPALAGQPQAGADTQDEACKSLGLSDAAAVGQEWLCEETHCLGLSLLNVALESGGAEIAQNDWLVGVIQDDICKSLLQNSRTDSLSVLSLTLRAIFNLFLHFKRHLKVQLEMFFLSVHLKIAGQDTAPFERRELALESLLEFCREPELMLELYENYDCDVRCTDLFATLVRSLITNAFPADGVQGARGGFTSLHRLALSGLLSILHSLALRCESHGSNKRNAVAAGGRPGGSRNSPVGEADAALGETELSRKKEQKRRVALAARSFNSEPSKCMSTLQKLGLVADPPTAESMAEFLRHTPALDLRMVGEYLSKRHDFNGQVRGAFMTLFPFQNLGLVEALRMLLSSFRLPGEAQLIERLMESFAESYFVCQPLVLEGGSPKADGPASPGSCGPTVSDRLKTPRWVPREKTADEVADHPDACGGPCDDQEMRVKMSCSDTIFVLSYSIIMLNTDLHNPYVKKRMTCPEFVKNNSGIDGGSSLPEFFMRDIYENIKDEEIRLHGETPPEGEAVVDDFFWEGILRRSESIDEFSTTERLLSETPPDETERDLFQVIMDASPIQTLSLCYESVSDASVVSEAMMGFQDLARISAYFEQVEAVNSLARTMCTYFTKAAASGVLTTRTQIALRAALQCVAHNAHLFREAEWRSVLDAVLQLWALDLLPSHLTEFDDFAGTDGRPLQSLCDLQPPFQAARAGDGIAADAQGSLAAGRRQTSTPRGGSAGGDGFFETLSRWLDDEIGDSEESDEDVRTPRRRTEDEDLLNLDILHRRHEQGPGSPGASSEGVQPLPVTSSDDPAVIHQQVKHFVMKSGFVEVFLPSGLTRLPPEILHLLAKTLVQLARPSSWSASSASNPSASGAADAPASPSQWAPQTPQQQQQQQQQRAAEACGAAWHEVADPIFCLELLTNMTCMPLSPGQSVSQLWPLVSTHVQRLLQHVISGNGAAEQQFIERLIVNTLRLCIRLIGNAELVPTLLSMLQLLTRLPPQLFHLYSERIACGLLLFFKERSYMWSSEAHDTWQALWLPTLHALAHVASNGSQKSSAQGFVNLQRLLLEKGTDVALPWEQLPFSAWEECLEQVLLPLLKDPTEPTSEDAAQAPGRSPDRQANAAQLICRVVLTHLPDWLQTSSEGFSVLLLRVLHTLVSEAAAPKPGREPLVESLKNLLLVLSVDPSLQHIPSPRQGEPFLEVIWSVVTPLFPTLQREIMLIINPEAEVPQPFDQSDIHLLDPAAQQGMLQ